VSQLRIITAVMVMVKVEHFGLSSRRDDFAM
jgi:hypothetical protein